MQKLVVVGVAMIPGRGHVEGKFADHTEEHGDWLSNDGIAQIGLVVVREAPVVDL